MSLSSTSANETALLIVDLQNDFTHPWGTYARNGQCTPQIAALPQRIAPLAKAIQAAGGLVIATQFTLVPGRGGQPIVAGHLKRQRPFLATGDFAPGSWAQEVAEELHPVDVKIEKVADSAFHMTRLDWVLAKLDIRHLLVCGIATDGAIAATVRDAHARDLAVTVIEDCCAAFAEEIHRAALEALRTVAASTTAAQVLGRA